MTTPAYSDFLAHKGQSGPVDGFDAVPPAFLFDFQAALVDWALRRGRAALFADCGLGKTPMQLAWADAVVRHTNRPVLILTPLAVSAQTIREAEKFGIPATRVVDGRVPPGAGIVVTHYERLHHFDRHAFAGLVCDESSILKSFDGTRKGEITAFARHLPYRLLCTATAAPNDTIELGTHSEALGELGFMDMLSRFFKNDQNTADTHRVYAAQSGKGGPTWRFKGYAEQPFWRWVASWARALRRPSDLGFDDARFVLPPLTEREHVVTARTLPEGMLFALPAVGLAEQRAERRRTIAERCDALAALVADTGHPALVWCHLNPEGDRLAADIPGAVQVSGADADDEKEEKFAAFAAGDAAARVLVTKPVIGAWGLNFQHCAHIACFPSHSFEQYYQGVRRCWRFGQTRPVHVDLVTTEGERGVQANLARKAAQADRMFDALVTHMRAAQGIARARTFPTPEEIPSWLSPRN